MNSFDSRDRPHNWGTYVLDNRAPQASARFSALADLYDPGTIRHLERIGVGRGWRCWEIGAGQGSMAAWLSERVGPDGQVLATDIDTRFLDHLAQPNVCVRRHNVVVDALPESTFDLVHARLVLVHLPEREKVIDRMIAALKPGGWLLAEEFDSISQLPAPDQYPWEVNSRSAVALRKVMIERGVDPGFGRALAAQLRTRGLEDVWAEGAMFMHQGGSIGTQLMRANYEQLREAILAVGSITADEFEEDLTRLAQAEFIAPSPVMWSVAGRRHVAEPI